LNPAENDQNTKKRREEEKGKGAGRRAGSAEGNPQTKKTRHGRKEARSWSASQGEPATETEEREKSGEKKALKTRAEVYLTGGETGHRAAAQKTIRVQETNRRGGRVKRIGKSP